jgi:hypothetical protein
MVESTCKNAGGDSRSCSDRRPSLSRVAICSRQPSRRLPTMTLLTAVPACAGLASRRCSTESSQLCNCVTGAR